MPLLTAPAALTKQLGSLSSLLQSSPSPKGDAGLSATVMQGQQEFGGMPQKQISQRDSGDFTSPFASGPKKMNPADLFGQNQQVASSNPYAHNSGSLGSLSGDVSVLNQYDSVFAQAAQRFGFDPNWLKSLAATERGWEGTSVAGAQGLMQIMPGGYAELEAQFPNWQSDPSQNIMLGAAILRAKVNENGGDLNLGTMRYLGVGSDAYGTTPDAYLGSIQGYYSQLQQNGGSFGQVSQINGLWGGNESGNSIVGIAEQYLGTPYVWGGIPGKGETPTGWDTVHEDTEVLMADWSSRKIKRIEPGDEVMAYTSDGPVPAMVRMVYKKGVKAMMRIETTRTIHRTTPNHPFLVYDAKKRLSSMVDASALNPLNMLVSVRPGIGESPHPDVAWIVGLMLGNGNINNRSLNLCVYGDIRERASEILARVTGSKPGHDEKHGIYISCAGFAKSLRMMGLDVHAHEKRVPDVVWRWDDTSRSAFLRGYLDTDGSRCDTYSYAVASASQDLMFGIRDLSASLGHKVSGYRKQERTKEIAIRGRVVKNARPLYWSRIRVEPTDVPYSWDFVTVISASDDEPSRAYDLSVDHPSETFIADGVAVHNCSGFTYWLDQNYGSGNLPMGSHYQYQYAVDNGSLFQDTSQLQPGDLIFFDTGNYAGAGAELNNAGHVAMYIGNGQIIHAANPSEGTIISDLNNGYYSQRFIGAMHSSYSGGGYQQQNTGSYSSGSFAQNIRQFMQNQRG